MSSLRSLFGEDADILRETDFQALLLAMAVVPLGNGLVSPILEPLLGPLETSAADIGLMISFFWAPSIVVVPLTGALADRFSRKTVLVPAMVLYGAAGVGIVTTTEFRFVLALRLLQGVGWAGIAPVVTTSIGDLYAGPTEATAQGLRITGAGAVGAAVPLLAGGLVGLAWQYPFLLYASVFPVAVLVYLWFDDPTAGDPSATATGSDGGAGSYPREMAGLVWRRRVVALVLARALPLAVWTGFITYNSIIVVQLLDGSPVYAGALLSVTSLVFALAASQAGRVTALFDRRFVPLVGANVCLGGGFALTVFAPSVVVAGVGMAVSGLGFGVLVSLYTSLLTGLAPPDLRGGLISLGATASRTVGTVTPVALGALVSVTTPTLGFAGAVRTAGLAAVFVGAGGSLLCYLVASVSPPAPAERSAATEG